MRKDVFLGMTRHIFVGQVELGVALVEAVLGLGEVSPAADVRREIANLGRDTVGEKHRN
jgi:hypothetical protein